MSTGRVAVGRRWNRDLRVRCALVLLAVAVVGGISVSASRAASGRCATAAVAEPFVLPDGSEHVGGKLTLCDRPYNPTQSFLATYVDGVAVGRFMANPRRTEGSSDRELVIFQRQRDGRLHLVGLRVPGSQFIDLNLLKPGPRV